MDVELPQPATLPLDLLLDIIARSDDVTTIVRCAVGCKDLCAAMLHFYQSRVEANGGFDPSLLMAVSYRLRDDSDTSIVVQMPAGRLRHFNTDILAGSGPLCSRDGLAAMIRRGELLVCNTITGHVTSLPSMGKRAQGTTISVLRAALLSVDGAGRSFELLVMMYVKKRWQYEGDEVCRINIFSSREAEWGAARDIDYHGLLPFTRAEAVVVGRVVHWLCRRRFMHNTLCILALHADSAQTTMIKLPQVLVRTMQHGSDDEHKPSDSIILTTSAVQGERRLSLVVAEPLVISMWTPEEGSSISWSRQVVIRRREIMSFAYGLDAYQRIKFTTFGERSGTLIFWLNGTGLVQLNLGTKKAVVRACTGALESALLHEIDLISILRCMI